MNRQFLTISLAAAAGGLVGASVALAATAGVKTVIDQSGDAKVAIGFGLDGETDKDNTVVVRRTGIRAGRGQTDEAALFVENTHNCGGGDCVALETRGGGRGIRVSGTRQNRLGVEVIMGNLNTSGSKLNRVALKAVGNLAVCGKSKNGDAACSNQTLIYVRGGGSSGNPTQLVARMPNGDEAVLASE